MKANFCINSPLSIEEATNLKKSFRNNDIDIYCGKEYFIVTYIGQRKYKYGKNAFKSVKTKIEYTIKNNI